MAKFEHDLISYEAPIPSSGCFLLIHLLCKLMNTGTTVDSNELLVQD